MGLFVSKTKSAAATSYTPTHYVAPFASVSGAVNDYADLGATSFSNSTNSGTPTTFGTALARASGTNKVQLAPGDYTGVGSGSTFVASFAPANDGTEGNPLVFFAQYPAAYNRGNSALWSNIRRPASVTGTVIGPVAGIAGHNDVVFDGFYGDEEVSPAGPSEGMFQITSALRCAFRRFYVDRGAAFIDSNYGNGYNGNSVYWFATDDCVLSDCYFEGSTTVRADQNSGAVELYNCVRPIIQHNECWDTGSGIFVKTEAPQSQIGFVWHMEEVQVRYNKIRTAENGIQSQTSRSTLVYQNLIEVTASGYAALRWGNTAANNQIDCEFSAYNNTLILPGSAGYGIVWQGASLRGTNAEWHSNLVQVSGAGSCNLVTLSEDSSGWGGGYDTLDALARFDFNYYVDTTPRWYKFGTGTLYTVLADWKAAAAAEGTDAYGNDYEENAQNGTVTFIDAGTGIGDGNYRLSNNGQAALTASPTGGPVGCYITGNEEIGLRAAPTY